MRKSAPSSLSRIETGQTPVCIRDLEYIMHQYGFQEPLRSALVELAERGSACKWWQRDVTELTPELTDFIFLESDCTRFRTLRWRIISDPEAPPRPDPSHRPRCALVRTL
jgi:hypothetical protein